MTPSRGFLETLALLALGAVAVFYLLGRWDAHLSAEQSAYARDGQAWLQAAKPFHADLAQRDSAIAKARAVLRAADHRQALLAQHDSLLAAEVKALGAAVPQPALDLIATLRSQVEDAGIARAALEQQLGATTAQRDAALERLAQADTLVRRGVQLVKCRILFVVPCPSRTTAFVVGAGIGAVGSFLLSRH